MAVVIGVPASADPGERRSPIVPDVVKKLRAAGVEIVVERGATDGAFLDADTLGEASWVDSTEEVLAAADVVWVIGPPTDAVIAALRPGTVRPSRVLVIGAGVAGLQAIATAKRLGAIVEAYDVRPDTREQVESLGAKFVDTGVSAAGAGGYARELTDEEKARQADKLGKAVAACDVLITTAAVPGKKAPLIITEAMVGGMKPGAVVVDMAAETGGNVAGTVAGKEVRVGPAHVVGPVNLPSRMPVHSSEMFSKNLFNFLAPMLDAGLLVLDWEDEVIAGTALTHAGEVMHAGVKNVLGL